MVEIARVECVGGVRGGVYRGSVWVNAVAMYVLGWWVSWGCGRCGCGVVGMLVVCVVLGIDSVASSCEVWCEA